MKDFFWVKRVYMTLLETLIAISLLSMLLVFVFGFFRELSELTRLTEKSQKESFQMRYLESRLGFIFERLVNENQQERIFCFYTQPMDRAFSNSTSLIFTFNNEVRVDPTFSGDVLARLYVDSAHCLCLAIWPLHVSEPYQYLQKEVLMSHVTFIEYEFYAAPEQVNNDKSITSTNIDPEKTTPKKGIWNKDEWAITYNQMPSILKLIVKVAQNPEDLKHSSLDSQMKTKDLAFHFVLPSSKNPIYYPSD